MLHYLIPPLATLHLIFDPTLQICQIVLIQNILNLLQSLLGPIQLILHFFAPIAFIFVFVAFVPKAIFVLGKKPPFPLFDLFNLLFGVEVCFGHFSNLFTCINASQNFASKLGILGILNILEKSPPMIFKLPFFFSDFGVVFYSENSITNSTHYLFHMMENRFLIQLQILIPSLYPLSSYFFYTVKAVSDQFNLIVFETMAK